VVPSFFSGSSSSLKKKLLEQQRNATDCGVADALGGRFAEIEKAIRDRGAVYPERLLNETGGLLQAWMALDGVAHAAGSSGGDERILRLLTDLSLPALAEVLLEWRGGSSGQALGAREGYPYDWIVRESIRSHVERQSGDLDAHGASAAMELVEKCYRLDPADAPLLAKIVKCRWGNDELSDLWPKLAFLPYGVREAIVRNELGHSFSEFPPAEAVSVLGQLARSSESEIIDFPAIIEEMVGGRLDRWYAMQQHLDYGGVDRRAVMGGFESVAAQCVLPDDPQEATELLRSVRSANLLTAEHCRDIAARALDSELLRTVRARLNEFSLILDWESGLVIPRLLERRIDVASALGEILELALLLEGLGHAAGPLTRHSDCRRILADVVTAFARHRGEDGRNELLGLAPTVEDQRIRESLLDLRVAIAREAPDRVQAELRYAALGGDADSLGSYLLSLVPIAGTASRSDLKSVIEALSAVGASLPDGARAWLRAYAESDAGRSLEILECVRGFPRGSALSLEAHAVWLYERGFSLVGVDPVTGSACLAHIWWGEGEEAAASEALWAFGGRQLARVLKLLGDLESDHLDRYLTLLRSLEAPPGTLRDLPDREFRAFLSWLSVSWEVGLPAWMLSAMDGETPVAATVAQLLDRMTDNALPESLRALIGTKLLPWSDGASQLPLETLAGYCDGQLPGPVVVEWLEAQPERLLDATAWRRAANHLPIDPDDAILARVQSLIEHTPASLRTMARTPELGAYLGALLTRSLGAFLDRVPTDLIVRMLPDVVPKLVDEGPNRLWMRLAPRLSDPVALCALGEVFDELPGDWVQSLAEHGAFHRDVSLNGLNESLVPAFVRVRDRLASRRLLDFGRLTHEALVLHERWPEPVRAAMDGLRFAPYQRILHAIRALRDEPDALVAAGPVDLLLDGSVSADQAEVVLTSLRPLLLGRLDVLARLVARDASWAREFGAPTLQRVTHAPQQALASVDDETLLSLLGRLQGSESGLVRKALDALREVDEIRVSEIQLRIPGAERYAVPLPLDASPPEISRLSEEGFRRLVLENDVWIHGVQGPRDRGRILGFLRTWIAGDVESRSTVVFELVRTGLLPSGVGAALRLLAADARQAADLIDGLPWLAGQKADVQNCIADAASVLSALEPREFEPYLELAGELGADGGGGTLCESVVSGDPSRYLAAIMCVQLPDALTLLTDSDVLSGGVRWEEFEAGHLRALDHRPLAAVADATQRRSVMDALRGPISSRNSLFRIEVTSRIPSLISPWLRDGIAAIIYDCMPPQAELAGLELETLIGFVSDLAHGVSKPKLALEWEKDPLLSPLWEGLGRATRDDFATPDLRARIDGLPRNELGLAARGMAQVRELELSSRQWGEMDREARNRALALVRDFTWKGGESRLLDAVKALVTWRIRILYEICLDWLPPGPDGATEVVKLLGEPVALGLDPLQLTAEEWRRLVPIVNTAIDPGTWSSLGLACRIPDDDAFRKALVLAGGLELGDFTGGILTVGIQSLVQRLRSLNRAENDWLVERLAALGTHPAFNPSDPGIKQELSRLEEELPGYFRRADRWYSRVSTDLPSRLAALRVDPGIIRPVKDAVTWHRVNPKG